MCFAVSMDSTSKDIFIVLDKFIAAIEETKQVLRSPCVPGKSSSCLPCEYARPQRKEMLDQRLCDYKLIQSRLMRSEDELHKSYQNYHDMDFINEHETQEREAEDLVTEMNSLLNQIASAANSLKKIYYRKSTADVENISQLFPSAVTCQNSV